MPSLATLLALSNAGVSMGFSAQPVAAATAHRVTVRNRDVMHPWSDLSASSARARPLMMGGGYPIDKVRAEAKAAGLEEISCKHSNMISFAPRDSKAPSFKRLDVCYTTGTVTTSLCKAQLVQRKIGFPLLRELMRGPRTHTGTGYHLQQRANASVPAVPPLTIQPSNEEVEAEARVKLKRLRREAADLEIVIAACVQRKLAVASSARAAAAAKAAAAKAKPVAAAAAKAAAKAVAAAKAAEQQKQAQQKEARRVAGLQQREKHARRRV